jgi:hypothetical protein
MNDISKKDLLLVTLVKEYHERDIMQKQIYQKPTVVNFGELKRYEITNELKSNIKVKS